MSKKQSILELFNTPLDEQRRSTVAAMVAPNPRYLIAFTPRSGSSHLCDVLKNTNMLGRPGEMLSRAFIPNILKSAPAASPDEYLDQVLKVVRTNNGVSGFKASWFQFNDFRQAMEDPTKLENFKFIHLTRRDLAAQAVSLYRATETNVFHTNVEHSAEELSKLATLGYDYTKIEQWCRHIEVQETGWRKYFATHNIFPLTITYEEIDEDVVAVVHRIARYIGRPRAASSAKAESIFRKVGERQNIEWACQFVLDRDAEARRVEAEREAAAAAAAAQAAAAPAEPSPADGQ